MRKQLLGLLVPLLAMVVVAGAADMTGKEVAAGARLQRLEVTHSHDGLRVEFRAKGTLTPKVSTLDSPARIVVDFPNTVMATAQNLISVGQDGVKEVRVGTDRQTPPTTRVVVDLAASCSHEIVAGPDGSFILEIHDAVLAHRPLAPAAKSVAAKSVAANSVPKLVPASAPDASVPITSAATTMVSTTTVTPAPASAENPGKPQDFTFVEPKYSVKKDDQTAEPAAKAQEAASRFADKTSSELVATSANAALGQASGNQAIQPAVNLAAEQKVQLEQKPAASGSKYTGEPISVNLKDVDLKDFFRLIHEISGLNVVLDPQVHGNLTIVLDDVPWDQALDIVLKNNDLSRQLDGNVLRIATIDTLRKEAENRRAQIDAEALAVDKVSITRFLSYAHAKDVLVPIKKFLSQRGDVVADERTNSLIVSDIPAVIPHIDRIIQQMDRKTQEVEIEARVVAATRSFARDIGVQLGFAWGNGTTSAGGAPAVGSTSPITNITNPLYYSAGGAIPLFSNLGAAGPTSGLQLINATNNMRLDAILTAAESRGLLKILSRPRVVTQNNIQAVVKQGTQIPIVTQSQLNGPPTTTYVSAFLRLTVTPQITSEGTIFLNVDVENTIPDYSRASSSNGDNPALITQQATTQVLVTDGGTVVIGGVIQTNNSLSISQVPLLGDIPYLGNLFKHRSVQTSTQELIFFITPRIVQT
ncbi:MAG TPA: type IV pilus secretin PilQ [Terriglobales bacterium]|jgi:type IV pilus secretin PilQ/predicted competence protein|nr:type IV pilus secretin PilQ [Terriglobales bacterium]